MASIPDCEVVAGGFPCQGFSLANLRRHGEDERNKLYRQFLRVLRAKKPPYFVAENVRGLLSLEGGEVAKEIVKGFEGCGYRVRYRVLNAADYGVPQTRTRVIFLGTRKDIAEEYDVAFPKATHSRQPNNGQTPWVSIGEALSAIPEPDATHALENHVCSQYKVTNRNFTGHRTTDSTKPSPTILARGNGRGGVCAIQHPNNHRRMSVRESATVQSFPLDFVFSGKLNSMYRQVGNAVPVVLAERIGEEIVRALSKREVEG
jgi:DNA (cytosine-5)-methyltransferase 1